MYCNRQVVIRKRKVLAVKGAFLLSMKNQEKVTVCC